MFIEHRVGRSLPKRIANFKLSSRETRRRSLSLDSMGIRAHKRGSGRCPINGNNFCGKPVKGPHRGDGAPCGPAANRSIRHGRKRDAADPNYRTSHPEDESHDCCTLSSARSIWRRGRPWRGRQFTALRRRGVDVSRSVRLLKLLFSGVTLAEPPRRSPVWSYGRDGGSPGNLRYRGAREVLRL